MIGIYKITNNATGQVYIGQSGRLEARLSGHKQTAYVENGKQYNDPLYRDIRKYGIENFGFEVLETISLDELEEKWIQNEVDKGTPLYNKALYPYTDKYYQARMFIDSEIDEIYALLRENKLSNIAIAKHFSCSSSTVDDINNGKKYARENISYPIRFWKRSLGEKNWNSMFTDDEVLELRRQFVYRTMSDLYIEFGKNINIKSFERIVNGRSYKHLPIYVKRKKCWIKDGRPYRLEP